MQLIPVIDIKNGLAVHAKRGQRDNYQPVNSALCTSAFVHDVMEAFLSLYPFQTFYLADLNAITASGDNANLLKRLLQNYPQHSFWIDSGYQAQRSSYMKFANYRPVLGSEYYTNANLTALTRFEKNFILSLDFSATGNPLGATRLFSNPDLWPAQVIVMTLARVGAKSGVDVDKLRCYQALSPATKFIAAGGVRNLADLKQLNKMGIQTALCATALHTQAITRADLENL